MSLWEAGIYRARDEAYKLLRRFGVESAADVNVEGFADRLGIHLVNAPLSGATSQLLVGPDHATIVLSTLARKLQVPGERRWAIAQEMGHYVCEHEAPPPESLTAPPFPCLSLDGFDQALMMARQRGVSGLPDDEDEANCFALALLTPERTLHECQNARLM